MRRRPPLVVCQRNDRGPGIVKPDGIAFGRSDREPFIVLAARPSLVTEEIQGTSFASPFTLGSSLGVRAQLGTELSPLTIRGLMVHRADPGGHGRPEIGWGRFESDAVRLITCEDDEALVVYQGILPVGERLRARVPVPREPLLGMVQLSATLVIAPEVDPEYPGLRSVSRTRQRNQDHRVAISDLESYLIGAFHRRFNKALLREEKRVETIEFVSSNVDLEQD